MIRGDRAAREFVAFWQRDGVVTAAMDVNVWDVVDDLKAIVASGRPLDAGRLADPLTPLAPRRQPGSGVSQGIWAETQWVIISSWSLRVEVTRRLGERVVGPASKHDTVLQHGHLGDDRPGLLRKGVARHSSADRHHHVDDEVGIVVEDRIAVDLEIAEGPQSRRGRRC